MKINIASSILNGLFSLMYAGFFNYCTLVLGHRSEVRCDVAFKYHKDPMLETTMRGLITTITGKNEPSTLTNIKVITTLETNS